MCIAILTTKGSKPIASDEFNQAMRSNKDGMGLGYVENGEFKVVKSLSRGDLVYNEYLRAVQISNVILHFRLATHGSVRAENCHPFAFGPDMLFIHNGVLKYKEKLPDDTVDSALFGERILSLLKDGWRDNDEAIDMIEAWLGTSKIVLLDREGGYTILNESKGHWADGSWFSNYTYRVYQKRTDYVQSHPWNGYIDSRSSTGSKHNKKHKKKYNKPKKESKKNGSDSEQLLLPGRGKNGLVLSTSLDRDFVPHGFDIMGYQMCTACLTIETVDRFDSTPIFLGKDEKMKCAGCKVTVIHSSPLKFLGYFSPDTLDFAPLRDVKEVMAYNDALRGTV